MAIHTGGEGTQISSQLAMTRLLLERSRVGILVWSLSYVRPGAAFLYTLQGDEKG